jgi:hypothetical protein
MIRTSMKTALLGVLFFTTSIANGQKAEVSEIRWDFDNKIVSKLHVKEVVSVDGYEMEEVRDLFLQWLSTKMKSGSVIEYEVDGFNGQADWLQTTGQPYHVNSNRRIWTKSIKCEDCLKAFKNARVDGDGHYQLDFRLKEGRFLLVMSNFYSLPNESYLSDWITDKDGIAAKEGDPRLVAIETLFESVKQEVTSFILSSAKTEHPFDNW